MLYVHYMCVLLNYCATVLTGTGTSTASGLDGAFLFGDSDQLSILHRDDAVVDL